MPSPLRSMKLQEHIPLEDADHMALARILTIAIAPAGQVSDLGVMWYSLELRNARSRVEGARRKARGCVAGMPDLCVRWKDRRREALAETYWIELKRRKHGRVADVQSEMHERLSAIGDTVAVCRGWQEAFAQIKEWRIPMRRVIGI